MTYNVFGGTLNLTEPSQLMWIMSHSILNVTVSAGNVFHYVHETYTRMYFNDVMNMRVGYVFASYAALYLF